MGAKTPDPNGSAPLVVPTHPVAYSGQEAGEWLANCLMSGTALGAAEKLRPKCSHACRYLCVRPQDQDVHPSQAVGIGNRLNHHRLYDLIFLRSLVLQTTGAAWREPQSCNVSWHSCCSRS